MYASYHPFDDKPKMVFIFYGHVKLIYVKLRTMDKHQMFPKIIIDYNRFLDPIFTAYIQSQPQWKNWVLPPVEEVKKQVNKYKNEWSKRGEKIVNGICEFTRLNFKQNIIFVHIVSGNPRPFSKPIILKSGYTVDEFITTLTHELVHNLFSDNKEIFSTEVADKLYPNEDSLTKNHIFLNATIKYVLVEKLNDKSLLEKEKILAKKSKQRGYARAWKIVEKEGYEKIKEKFIYGYKRPLA